MRHPAAGPLAELTERWFVRQGVPSMIEGYGFVSHVLPRMLPSLAFVALASLGFLVPLRAAGSWRWIVLAGVILVTPLAAVATADIAPDGLLPAVPLNGRQERNLLVMLATRQLVQAVVVGTALFTFFLILGIIVVTPETAEQWIGGPPARSGLLPGVPVALLRNATLLAGFGSMYFAVTSMSDADHRRQFFAPIIDEVERILAVHASYLAVREVARP